VNIAAHEHYRRKDDGAEHQPNARHNIHGGTPRVREPPAVLDGDVTRPGSRNRNPTSPPLKTRKG
jgi:hypothetical protein